MSQPQSEMKRIYKVTNNKYDDDNNKITHYGDVDGIYMMKTATLMMIMMKKLPFITIIYLSAFFFYHRHQYH